MKTFFILIASLFLIVVIAAALLLFTPLRFVLPATSNTVADLLPDYFIGDRGSLTLTPGGLPKSADQNGVPSDTPVWSIPGQNGTTIDVSPFETSSNTAATSTVGPSDTKVPPAHNVLVSGADDGPYAITYFANDNSFTITLYKEPLGKSRDDAESELLKKLNITKDEACWLRHAVLTLDRVNTFYAGKNLGFSFCPGATAL